MFSLIGIVGQVGYACNITTKNNIMKIRQMCVRRGWKKDGVLYMLNGY